jgi:hypothetical protein
VSCTAAAAARGRITEGILGSIRGGDGAVGGGGGGGVGGGGGGGGGPEHAGGGGVPSLRIQDKSAPLFEMTRAASPGRGNASVPLSGPASAMTVGTGPAM